VAASSGVIESDCQLGEEKPKEEIIIQIKTSGMQNNSLLVSRNFREVTKG
jgi:hypothetical protein